MHMVMHMHTVVEHEITRAFVDVAEAEVAARLTGAMSDLAGVNQTASERDLLELFRRADTDGNGAITFDELLAMVRGELGLVALHDPARAAYVASTIAVRRRTF